MKKNAITFLIIILSFLGGNSVYSQCKGFAKKKCIPELEPYIHNGQLNSVNLFPGESAALTIPFYSGQEYRILACAHKILGEEVYYEVKTKKGKLVYSSQGKGAAWDFKVASTQELIIDVFVPETDGTETSELSQSGCISILIGFKQ